MRICSECGKPLNRGYCIMDGVDYFCSEACLTKNIPIEEYLEMFENNEAYWTEWEDESECQKLFMLMV